MRLIFFSNLAKMGVTLKRNKSTGKWGMGHYFGLGFTCTGTSHYFARWRAGNTTHRPPERPHKPHAAAYVHMHLCLNEAYFFSNLAKMGVTLKRNKSTGKWGMGHYFGLGFTCTGTPHYLPGGVLVTPRIDHRNARTSHTRPHMYTCTSA